MTRRLTAHDRLDFLATGARPYLLLVLLSLASFLPGIASLPPVDRDEARYIQATRQMLETGDYLDIRFQEEARNKKPAGIYWLQALAVGSLGRAESTAVWPYRIVSVAGGTAAVLLLFAVASAIFDRRTALLAAACLATSAGLVFEAHIATTDAVLLAAGIGAEGILGLAYLASRRGETLASWLVPAFWLAEIAALFIKGPVIPVLTILTAGALAAADRKAGWLRLLRPLWGVPITVVAILPWLWLIQSRTGGAFIKEAVGHDFIGKLLGGQEAHGGPPGYYFVLTFVTFWPASFFLGAAAMWLWRSRRLPASRLLLAWIVPYWLVLELVPTKLPHYALPLYPALALAAARAVLSIAESGMASPRGWVRQAFPAVWLLVGMIAGVGMLVAQVSLGVTLAIASVVPVAFIVTAAWHLIVRERAAIGIEALAITALTGLITLTIGFGIVLPRLRPLWLSRSAAELVHLERKSGERVSATGYAEPSLVFLLGTDTALMAAEPAATALADHTTSLALVADSDEAAFRHKLHAYQATPQDLGHVSGLDYSTGHWLTLTLYRLPPS